MKNGDIIKYEEGLEIGDNKNDAIAIIFYNGTGLGGSGTRVLGMSANLEAYDFMAWSDAKPTLTGLRATVSGTTSSGSSNRNKNGSSNYTYATTTDSSITYTAMEWCNNYKDHDANIVGTSYETNWYLPSIDELYTVYTNLTTINSVITNVLSKTSIQYYTYLGGTSCIAGGTRARDIPYWTSNTMDPSDPNYTAGNIWGVFLWSVPSTCTRITNQPWNFTGNTIPDTYSGDGGIVMPIRQFN